MLPLTRDRHALAAATREELRSAEEKLQRLVAELPLDQFLGAPTLYLAYAGPFYARASASLLYWPLRQVTEKDVHIDPAESLSYHVLAYRDTEAAIIAFFEPGSENTLARLSEASRLTGTRLLAVTPPLPPPVEDRVASQGAELVIVEGLPLATAYLVLSAKLAAEAAKRIGGIELRRKRIIEEYSNIHSVYDDLVAETRKELDEIASTMNSIDIVAYTPTMEPAAAIASLAVAAKRGTPPATMTLTDALSVIAHGLRPRALLALATTAEQDLLREARFKLGFTAQQTRLTQLVIGTDPLTAPLYASIALTRLLAGEG